MRKSSCIKSHRNKLMVKLPSGVLAAIMGYGEWKGKFAVRLQTFDGWEVVTDDIKILEKTYITWDAYKAQIKKPSKKRLKK